MKVALISCAKKKQEGCHRAQDMYTSVLFKCAWHYADAHFDRVFILSAKHGLLDPRERIRKYDSTLHTMSVAERKRWANKVVEQIRRKVADDIEIYFFCGRKYREFIIQQLQEYAVFIPLEGRSIGQQLQWYKMINNSKYDKIIAEARSS